MYDFPAVADRPTLAVHNTITQCSADVTTCFGGSAHTTSGDARCGDEGQVQFLKKSASPDSEGTNSFLPKKSSHLQAEGETNHAGSRKTVTLHSGQFVVPGAHDIVWVMGAPNFVQSVRSNELLKVLGCSGAEVPCNLAIGSHKVRPFSLYSLHCSPTPRSELEYPNFL